MIKDMMVWLDGGISDEIRLAAVADIARWLDAQVVIGLFLNVLPLPGRIEGDATAEVIDRAREAGDLTEALLARRLQQLERPVEIRRFDVLADDIARIAAREARSADTFVALRPNGAMDPERLVEGVLFGSGRHLYLVPETERPKIAFDRILIAWNGSREGGASLGRKHAVSAQGGGGRGRGRDRRAPNRGRGDSRCRCGQPSQASWNRRRPSSVKSRRSGVGARLMARLNGERLTLSSWADTAICGCASGC